MDGSPLSDPQRSLLEELEARSTLFSSCPPVENKAQPEDAVWLEMKVVRRFVVGRASPGPNRAYGAEMNRAIRDLHKLDKDRRISRAGLILVLFAESQEVAARDVRDATILAMKDGLRPKEPRRVTFPIPDRIGNAFLELVIMPLNCG